MKLSLLLKNIAVDFKQYILYKFVSKPHLVFIPPQFLSNLSSTVYVFMILNSTTQQWQAFHVQIPQRIVIKKSTISSFLVKYCLKTSIFLQKRKMFYPTGVYMEVAPHVRLCDDLLVMPAQFPNVELSEEALNSIIPQIVQTVNQNSKQQLPQGQPLHANIDLSKINIVTDKARAN